MSYVREEFGKFVEKITRAMGKGFSTEATTEVVQQTLDWCIEFFEKNDLDFEVKVCPIHNASHGAEAEGLRKGIEKIIKEMDDNGPMSVMEGEQVRNDLQRLLDTTDAADSLRYLELMDHAKGLVKRIEKILTTRAVKERPDPMPAVVKELKWQGWQLALEYISDQMMAKALASNEIVPSSIYQGLVNLMASYRYDSIFDHALKRQSDIVEKVEG